MDIRIKHPTTKLSWFDRISLPIFIAIWLFLAGSACFLWGTAWADDTNTIGNTVMTAQ